jgi:hypothetical protein
MKKLLQQRPAHPGRLRRIATAQERQRPQNLSRYSAASSFAPGKRNRSRLRGLGPIPADQALPNAGHQVNRYHRRGCRLGCQSWHIHREHFLTRGRPGVSVAIA